jgi:uncharacterized protein (TIGR03437 family)
MTLRTALLALTLSCGSLSFTASGQTYLIFTMAGNGTQGYSGDNGIATSAELALPGGIAFDKSGNLYIADGQNNVVRKVSGGVITTIAGNGTAGYTGDKAAATAAELNNPTGVAVDSSGNVYIADSANMVVRMVNPAGTITTFAGSNVAGFLGDTGPANQAELNVPTAVAVDSSGNVYICDTNNNAIREVISGTINTIANTQAYLQNPEGVWVDAAGDIFVADTGNERVVEFTAVLYDFFVIAGTGVAGFSGDNGPALNAQVGDPKGVAVDSQGYVYIADTINSRIRKVGLDGTITTIAGTGQPAYGGQGQYATTAPMAFPAAVAIDPTGNVWLSDTHNSVVRMLQLLAPSIEVNGVVNSADFSPIVSQGALASIAGVNLSSEKASATLPLPLSLADVTVTVNGVIAPILYVQPTLINFQVPWQTQPGTATVQVTVNGVAAPAATVTAVLAAPAIFSLGGGIAAIENANGSINTPSNPAKEGSQIAVYLTGSGPVSPPVSNAVGSPVSPLARLTGNYSATIGPAVAQVQFAGLTPGTVGLTQFNLIVPEGLAAATYALTISIDGQTSNTVSVAIAP